MRQLQVFVAVARAGSVSGAARALAMSQSAASGALADLERQFDVALFDRVGKSVRLSDLGRSVRPKAEALLDRARELEEALAGRAGPGGLRVGATLTIGNYLAVPLVARFLREHPGARVTLDIANTAEIARKVKNFDIDVGLVEGDLADRELEVTRWRGDELAVFAAPGHPLSRRRSLDDAALRGARWIVREPGSGTRQAFDRAMQGILHQLDLALELSHTEAIKRAVRSGLGIGCVSRIALEDDFREGALRPLAVPHRDLRRQFFFVVHRDKYRTRDLAAWLALCRSGGAAV